MKAQPHLPANRIHSLDLLRGFALLGILLMNITSFSQVGIAYLNPLQGAGLDGYNQYFWNFNALFADVKFMSIFSILFGAGVLLFTDNMLAKGRKPWVWHYRRMFLLLLFGFFHAYCIWMGDILVAYAICGALVFLMRNWSSKVLGIIGGILFVVPILFSASTYYGMPVDELERTFAFWTPSQEEIAMQVATFRGSYLEQMPLRIEGAIELQTLVFAIEQFWRVLSMMMLGMILYRSGFLSAKRTGSFYRKVSVGALIIGLSLSGLGLYLAYQKNWDGPYMMNIGGKYNYIGSVFTALGYIALIMLLHQSQRFPAFQELIRKVGRMAFTNYILSSVICTFIFYGHGLGLYATMDRLQLFGIVLLVWMILLFLSAMILSRYRYGPLEWFWRKLTYFQFGAAK